MANNYVVIDDKRYRTTGRSFTPKQRKARQTNTTIGGKVTTQTFGFTDYRWQLNILVELSPEDPLYGSKDDLETAYDAAYVSFIDQFGAPQGDVIFEGELSLPPEWALLDSTVPFIVSLSLRKRQT